ncbi:tRNA (N6-isopentenyl adenosine(37)-C2)-methylthiotransferase MiaB [Paracoccus sp. S-4012]|uniref:tRNA (N6-isopentenyl adenosine(37)-C2)-methylthiotransferase MiaB n=1 Tax=Paracoccus sp. S-4012 TaxID=2665648 RepID=UPI0012B09B67|nr:tRNA (N6-isopentenyl adenosine(37)-C2)-methylthiotransferase MiaB [Paracoccus sp. S-4012]MRX51098.1 tRNA (N6-isopentenyl adenosine(37)-C2)-methylthiotransferase MiaB [Paracoccus sp. S-4012]
MTAPKRLFIKTYGCQMNVYDSERMAAAMGAEGYVQTDSADDADMVLLNTCHIREKAAEKLYSDLGRLKPLKAARPDLKIGVAGCVAQAEGEVIRARMPLVDLVVGPQAYYRLPAMARGEAPAVVTDFPAEDKFDHLPPATRRAPTAFLTVQEGCDKFCAFCVVPYTRGAEVSRPAARIIAEAQGLVARGVGEITLLGQNVNGWHGEDGQGLGHLIRALAGIEGLARIRYTTSHPNDMAEDLIAAHRDVPQLMPYLHLPVQSGSDRILKAMNRRHTADHYLRLVDRIRAARPDILLTSDFITGFPGETDADHAATLRLVEQVGFATAFSFAYSARPGTPAADRTPVPRELAEARLHELQALLTRQQKAAQQAMVGRTVGVLFEKPGRKPGQMVGKSDYLHSVFVEAPEAKAGDLVQVRIIGSAANSLEGRLVA